MNKSNNNNNSSVPSFLVECDSARGHSECRNHAVHRAFDLSTSVVSWESLSVLAFTQLLTFLLQDPLRNVVWLSKDVYLTDNHAYMCCNYSLTVDLGHSVKGCLCLCLCGESQQSKSQSHHDNNNSNNESSSCAGINTLLKLLAHCKTLVSIKIYQGRYCDPHKPFPASLEALETFVRDASSARTLHLDIPGLTMEQWRVLIFDANPNTVNLSIDFTSLVKREGLRLSDRVMALLVQATSTMRLHQGPAKLELRHLQRISTQSVYDFLQTLTTTTRTTSLKELVLLHGITWESFLAICRAISQNRTLEKLELGGPVINNGCNILMTDTEWELICSALASHPTLQDITCHLVVSQSSRSRARDQILMNHLSHNKVITSKFQFHYEDCCFNAMAVQDHVAGILEANRFRIKVQKAMIGRQEQHETNNNKITSTRQCQQQQQQQQQQHQQHQQHQQQLIFYLFLMSAKLIEQRPAPWYRYMLLRENSSLLAELARPDRVLYRIWHQVMQQVWMLENEMEQYGMPLPSLQPLLLEKKRKTANSYVCSKLFFYY